MYVHRYGQIAKVQLEKILIMEHSMVHIEVVSVTYCMMNFLRVAFPSNPKDFNQIMGAKNQRNYIYVFAFLNWKIRNLAHSSAVKNDPM